MTTQPSQTVWVFTAPNAQFPGAIFSSMSRARGWIAQHKLSGLLTEYPLDMGAYDWAVGRGAFTPRRPEHASSAFIGSFSSAHMAHVHFEDGEAVG